MPVYSDQPGNAKEAHQKGYGIYLPMETLTEESLFEAVTKVLNDPSYTKKAEEWGRLLMDQITQPIETAVWWIEYAVRYPGMKHMRSPVHDLHWTQYFLLDVIAFLAVVILLIMTVLLLVCKFCFAICCVMSKRKRD